jgi:Tfp pilus assembly protein PilV
MEIRAQMSLRKTRKAYEKERGFGLLEAVIAIFITTVGIFAIMSLQPSAWSTAAKADYLGRAAGILSQELEKQQARIMNPCNPIPTATTTEDVRSSGGTSSLEGDMIYSVTTTISSVGSNVFTVAVTVSWNNGANSIRESMVISRQELWRFPEGCTDA